MTQKTDNLRVKRTKILLREALIALIEERGFDALTIGELTERAMVSRAAFYRNYQDKYDLVEQIFEETMSTLFEAIGEFGREHPLDVWIRFFEQIAQYDQLYRALLGKKGSPWFVRGLITCAEYQLFLDDQRAGGKYHQPDHWPTAQFAPGQAFMPVVGVRPSDAQAFCSWLTEREQGLWQYRLPKRGEIASEEVQVAPVWETPLGYWENEGQTVV